MRSIPSILVAAALLAGTSAAGAVRFDRGQIQINGDGVADGGAIVPGMVASSFTFYDYSACDGREEDCVGLPYAGRRAVGQWNVEVSDTGASHRFDLFQGSDIGGPLEHEFFMELFFVADRPFVARFAGDTGFEDLGCVSCNRVNDQGIGGTVLRPDGRWELNFTTLMQGRMLLGGQRLFQSGQLTLAEVPEPSTWAMLLVGFGLVGTVARRQRYWAV